MSMTEEVLWAGLRIVIVVGFTLSIIPLIIWWERRLLSWMQDRIGPNRVGPFGLLQPIADGIKLFMKEEIVPASVDRLIYMAAPAAALLPALIIGATLPWGPNRLLTPIADVDIGILWVLAVSSFGIYGVMLGGWASNNKYSLLGGLRSSAQLISYELAMGVALYSVVLPTGSLRMTEVVATQHEPLWGVVLWAQNWFIFTPYGLLAGVIFLITMVAETNRAPFDLPEAESELIGGFHTEYSSMKFAVFFMAELGMMMLFSGVFAVMFLGGWSPLPLNWEYLANQSDLAGVSWLSSPLLFIGGSAMAPVWFVAKLAVGVSCYIWLRATLPRLRYDQLMALGWKLLLPMAALNFVVVAIWMLYGWWAFFGSVAVLALLYFYVVAAILKPRAERDKVEIRLVDVPVSTAKTIEVGKES
ncbi:MAG: NADH-quinone oxidoreductase subunit H [Armatimonadetes bacterium]|nr:NADH-quinone oxidoreductase subunit H [Armatimonadota bacterium]